MIQVIPCASKLALLSAFRWCSWHKPDARKEKNVPLADDKGEVHYTDQCARGGKSGAR